MQPVNQVSKNKFKANVQFFFVVVVVELTIDFSSEGSANDFQT